MELQDGILKGNEAIALFLNWRKGKDDDSRWGEEWFNNDGIRMGRILKFSTDWNALIPVIDKITSLPIYGEYVNFSSSMMSDGGICINTRYIEVTFENVVEFIEWYETNKTS